MLSALEYVDESKRTFVGNIGLALFLTVRYLCTSNLRTSVYFLPNKNVGKLSLSIGKCCKVMGGEISSYIRNFC
jgi:hypothetical protein